MWQARGLWLPLLFSLALLGCEGGLEPSPPEAGEAGAEGALHVDDEVVLGGVGLRAAFAGDQLQLVPQAGSAEYLSLRFDAQRAGVLRVRGLVDGQWTPWEPLAITWSEGILHTARHLFSGPATKIELRGAEEAQLDFLALELFERAPTPELCAKTPSSSDFVTIEQALAPPGIVNLRSAWGARSTSGCGSAHTPTHITIHHTATPTNDSISAEARMRQMQSYHIDTNGWCDIGYHFIISHDGRIWQGRENHERTGAHVYMHNTNNVGISFMGTYESDPTPQAMLDSASEMVSWLSESYNIPMDRTHILGHREWPDNSTTCPGNYLYARLSEIIENASERSSFQLSSRWASPRTLVDEGSSAGVADVLVGETATAYLMIHNEGDIAHPVIIGYDTTGDLIPTQYLIETDAPAYDGMSWRTSDAMQISTNPAPEAPLWAGSLQLGTVAPGEHIRLSFTVRAETYSFGSASPSAFRFWAQDIPGFYSAQLSWDDAVEINEAGTQLREALPLDVYATDRWDFGGQNEEGLDREGWSASRDVSELAVNTVETALSLKASGTQPQIMSPSWTSIDASVQNQLILRGRHHGGTRVGEICWARDGGDYDANQCVPFTSRGDSEYEVFTFDMGVEPAWTGVITRLWFEPWEGGPFGDGAEAWFGVEALRVVEGGTTLVDADGDGSLSDVDCDDQDLSVYPGAPEQCDNKDNDCDGFIDEDGVCDAPVEPVDQDQEDTSTLDLSQDSQDGFSDPSIEPLDGGNTIKIEDSCACSLRDQPSSARWPLLLLLCSPILWWRRRR